MNKTLLAAHIASIVPAMNKDSAVNNETLLNNLLTDFEAGIRANCATAIRIGRQTREQLAAEIEGAK